MSILVGEVVGVNGVTVTARLYEESNKDTLFYGGKLLKGISIREFVKIERGFKEIICLVEGEFLDEKRYEDNEEKRYYIRRVELKPIGYFEKGVFFRGYQVPASYQR